MKRSYENIVTSFFYYMWNGWGSEQECRQVFGSMSNHFWEKWCSLFGRYHGGAAERFYAELSPDYRRRLVDRACEMYNGRERVEPTESRPGRLHQQIAKFLHAINSKMPWKRTL